jgi:hypothetical protein
VGSKKVLLLAAMVVIAASGFDGGSGIALGAGASELIATKGGAAPPPPKIPRNFEWSGRYIVPDLDAEVPFTWNGKDGNFQMIAGDEDSPIHFTNLIYDGHLYTLTYKWPGVPRNPCSDVGPFTLDELNKGLGSSRFVGVETLHDKEPREVNHFRAGVVYEPGPDVIPAIPGVPQVRIPIMSGDLYVDRKNPKKLWKVLQFGLQNLYDVNLDEWIVIDHSKSSAGEVTLPDECASVPAPVPTPTTPG